MATGGQRRKRSDRVAALGIPPGQWERAWASLRRRDVLGRIGLAAVSAVLMALVIQGWDPPLAYRTGYTPPRDIVARVTFEEHDPEATRVARERAKLRVPHVYARDNEPLVQLRAKLRNTVAELASAESLDEADGDTWSEFLPKVSGDAEPPSDEAQARLFQQFRNTFTGAEGLDQLDVAVSAALAPYEQRGLLHRLDKRLGPGNEHEIVVYPQDKPGQQQTVKVADAMLGDGAEVRHRLRWDLPSPEVSDLIFAWLYPRLATLETLALDEERTRRAIAEAADAVEPQVIEYLAGTTTLAPAGEPLDGRKLALLQTEHERFNQSRSVATKLVRLATITLLAFALFVLCGMYMRYRQRGPLASATRLTVLLMLAILTVILARIASHDAWRAEIVPLMLFGMTVAIVHRQELGLLLSAVVALIIVLAIGHGLPEFLLLVGVSTTAVLNMGRIRTRSKLIYVGLAAGCVALAIDVGLGIVYNQPLGWNLLSSGLRGGLWALAAGFLMTGLLPFVEKTFGVLTDLSLLELGDISHPLLQELVRRAPSTYNHSITVGSIAEAAADSIGGRGLLCRVGAYFHDIGKMLKPGYFVENQGQQQNRHETLVPAMSTLVIVAHIKDGGDLARQYRLPQPIVDLIEQHHGTTRVGFFYERASQQQREKGENTPVDERTFRYPGPKPQTKEAGVLMLADAVESASRTLVDPTPRRIESLVREIAERRLHDGQFDESGLTLRELRTIEKSLIMSLTAIYHGRLKYPDQQTA